MKLVVTIDVEEEGLFSGSYASHDNAVTNVTELASLDPLFRELGIRPTLLVTYPVITHDRYAELLTRLTGLWGGEIGAHLHHWNTPPLKKLPYPEPVPSDLIPSELLAQKLENLLVAIREVGVEPTSFRMGRFNLGPRMFSLLEQTGIIVDSSIAPMRKYYGGPDHFSAGTDPYFPNPENLSVPGDSQILEVPMTILPLFRNLGGLLDGIGNSVVPARWVSWFAMNLGSLPAQPLWTGMRRLKAAVKLHAHRGGKVLNVFFHSSELIPGGCPQHQTAEDVERFRRKLREFFAWLWREMPIESVTLTELSQQYTREKCPGNGPFH